MEDLLKKWKLENPIIVEVLYNEIVSLIGEFETFDLLSNIAFYNNLHDSDKYSDYRDDRHFFVAEVVALISLKRQYVNNSSVKLENYQEKLQNIQEKTLQYCIRKDSLDSEYETSGKNLVKDITSLFKISGRKIRNSGLPDHHLIFSEKLYQPIENQIKEMFGFTVAETVIIRKLLPKFINEKYQSALISVKNKVRNYIKKIEYFKKTAIVDESFRLSKSELVNYSSYPHKKLFKVLYESFFNELHFKLSEIYTFNEGELATFTGLDISVINKFLTCFLNEIPLDETDFEVHGSVTLLSKKPFLKYKEKYLIPSFPLINWAVEEAVEAKIIGNAKLSNKFSLLKHDFLLNQGLAYFKELFPSATIFPPNLYYSFNGERNEVDGLIMYDNTIFIIEAKGNRISSKSKSGHELKTKDHLKDIIQDSYLQATRVIDYIKSEEKVEFETENKEKHLVEKQKIESFVIISLALEPIGNLAMLIKKTNEIGYFKNNIFPWIISLYDLVVISDLIKNPIMLIHYIKQREEFLNNYNFQIYEELDLIAYFLHDGLYINKETNNADKYLYFTATDEINDYYMYKFGHKTKFTEVPKLYISDGLNKFLIALDKSKKDNRIMAGLWLLELSKQAIEELLNLIKKTKKDFAKDGILHDCSTYSKDIGGIGVTYMISSNHLEISQKLERYCFYKQNQLKCNRWIGLGDVSKNVGEYDFQYLYFEQIE